MSLQKYFRIGCKEGNRIRSVPEATKLAVLAKAPKLRFHKDYSKVYISPDMTRFERSKHK